MASWLYELADPELTAMYAESQDENTRPAVSSEMSLSRDCQSSLLRSLGFWLSTLLIEKRAHRKLVTRCRCVDPPVVSLLLASGPLLVSEDYTSTLESE